MVQDEEEVAAANAAAAQLEAELKEKEAAEELAKVAPTGDAPLPEAGAVKDEAVVLVMKAEDAKETMGQQDFKEFFDDSSLKVERLLAYKEAQWTHKYDQHYDPLADSKEGDGDDADHEKGDSVEFSQEFTSERYTVNRAVTSIDFSVQKPELMCAGYNANPDTPHEPDGIVCLWDRHMNSRPMDVFECQSAVLSCSFSQYSPHVIVGGTYSGQVVLWDCREAKRTPVQRSAINSKCHTHPVFCLAIVGSQNAHSLVTVSTDGKLCEWDMDTLNEPQGIPRELKSGTTGNHGVAGTAFAFPYGGVNEFVLGAEDGGLFMGHRAGARVADQLTESFQDIGPEGAAETGHFGPVTAVDFLKAPGAGDFSHLFLSSSTDWTSKLWSFRDRKKPLLTFESASDYVYDVRWSPTNPGLFATVDGTGCLDVWNLCKDVERPASRTEVNGMKQSLNRVKWTPLGKQIAVGDANGSIFLYDVAPGLANPKDGWKQKLKDTLADIERSTEELADTATTGSERGGSAGRP